MLPRHRLFGLSPSPVQLLLLAIAVGWSQSPQSLFEPNIDMTDSVSIRQRYEAEIRVSRYDLFVRTKDSKGLPLRIDGRATDDSGVHTTTYEYTWNSNFPNSFDRTGQNFPSKFVQTYVKNGALQSTDTTWSDWDPIHRTLIVTKSSPKGVCRWRDSMSFDARTRLVYRQSCSPSSVDTAPYRSVFRAGYESESDSFPRWASERERISATYTHVDSMYSVGPANRPDSMRGTSPAVLVWNAQGRLLSRRTLNDPDGGEEFAYDPAGRLIREIRNPRAKDPDTAIFLYAWETSLARRAPLARQQTFRLTANGVLVDLPAPDQILLEVIGPDGKRQTAPTVQSLPAGRTLVLLSSSSGSLLRVRGSSSETILVIPVRR